MKRRNRAVLLDRDGTLLVDRDYLADPKGIRIYPGVIPALRKLKRNGWKLVIGTNQSGVGRGYFTLADMHRVHRALLGRFRRGGVRIDGLYYCPHRPDAGCACRKPKIGMLRRAAREHGLDLPRCVAVGDKECDILWGRRARARTVLVLTGYGRRALAQSKIKADHVARSLAHAAEWILKHGDSNAGRN